MVLFALTATLPNPTVIHRPQQRTLDALDRRQQIAFDQLCEIAIPVLHIAPILPVRQIRESAKFDAAMRARIRRSGPDHGIEETEQRTAFPLESGHHFLRVERVMRRRRPRFEAEYALFDEAARFAANGVEVRPLTRKTGREFRKPQDRGVDEVERGIKAPVLAPAQRGVGHGPFAVLLPTGEALMFPQLPDRATGIDTDPNLPGADQLGAMVVQRLHGDTLKLRVAFLQLAAARDDQTMLIACLSG